MKPWLLPAVSVVTLVIALGLFVASRRPTPLPVAPAPNDQESAALRKELERAKQELEVLREEAESQDPGTPPRRRLETPPKTTDVSTPELLRQLEEGRKELEVAREQSEALRKKLEEADQRLSQLEQQQRKLEQSESSARSEVQSLTERIKDWETDRQAQATRLSDLEARNTELRKRQDDSGRKLAQMRKIAEGLEDLTRRREAFMTSILGRYREATDLFRAMALRLDNMPDRSAAGSNDLARIQNAISLADEDMRQLRALNTRSTQLQKDLQAVAP